MRLPDQIVEGLGPILSREDLVAHGLNLNAPIKRRKQKMIRAANKIALFS